MKYAAIDEQTAQHSTKWMCRLLKVSRSSFYEWRRSRAKSIEAARAESLLLLHVKAVHEASRGTYGSPRVHQELLAQGVAVGRRRVERLMREAALVGRSRRKFHQTTRVDKAAKPADNLLNRNFHASAANQKWVTDITYLSTKEGFVYLAAILDLFSNHVVGFALADHMRTELALEALEVAVRQRAPKEGLLHHSDRGSQYTSKAYQDALRANGFTCSMSRKGECWDNSCAESFFGRMKEELRKKSWNSKQEAIDDVREYIVHFYNPIRIQKKLGYVSPLRYELLQEAAQRAA